ncbi:MAG: hypothetical protein JST12_21325 [Armatimonadetes bacterium]|nr:hypothetical protein [Armatimonadota bacterium]
MIIWNEGTLNREFLESSTTGNLRATLRALLPNREIKGKSREDLFERFTVEDQNISFNGLTEAFWKLVDDELRGQFHVMEIANPHWANFDRETVSTTRLTQIKDIMYGRTHFSTDEIIDARIVGGNGNRHFDMLLIGEAAAEQRSENDDREEDGFVFKAFKQVMVPILSKVVLGIDNNNCQIITRPVHRDTSPREEMGAIQQRIEYELGCPFPSLAAIPDALRTLLVEGRLTISKIASEGEDGAKSAYTAPKGHRNADTEEIEERLKGWETKSGVLTLDQATVFRVDSTRAVFSFWGKTTIEEARNAIQTIRANMP